MPCEIEDGKGRDEFQENRLDDVDEVEDYIT
jgi:hypothetical protein